MKQDIIDGSVNAFQYVITLMQTSEELKLISLCLSIASTLIILIPKLYHIIKNAYKRFKTWYKDAIKDKRIDKNELKQLKDIATDTADEIVEVVEEIENEHEGG